MKPIALGIVGLGRAGKSMHLAELKGKEGMFRICAVCDLVKERRDAIAEQYGAKAYACIEDLLQDQEVEMIDIATRSCDHFMHAKQALQAGKHVFLEKPYSTTAEEARELAELGTQPYGPKLYIRHNRRWEGKFNQVMELCNNGTIGDVFEVRLTRNSYELRHDWQTLSEFGGGQLLNWGPHIVDHALNFCGGEYTSLYADMKQINASGDCEDSVHIAFKGVNGRFVDMEINCAAGLKTPEYLAYGTRGALVDMGDTLHIRRLKAEFERIKELADSGNPLDYFKAGTPLPFEEFDIPVEDVALDQTWEGVYRDLREGVPYRIKMSEALKVIEVIDHVKREFPVEKG